MQRDDLVYVERMLEMARKVVSKTQNLDRISFDASEDLKYAVVHFIQIIGEAARSVSKEFAEAHPEVPWKNIVGMRMKLVHDYMEVNFDIVWDVAKEKLPPLVQVLERML